MKLKTILNEFNPIPGGYGVGPHTTGGNETPGTMTPNMTPGKYEEDFVDKKFELEFLDKLLSHKNSKNLSKSLSIKNFGYSAINRIKNLARIGLVQIIDTNGTQSVSITPEGEEWLEEFRSQQHGAFEPFSVDPGGWNPVSGAFGHGMFY